MFLHGQSHTSTRMTAQSHYLPRMPLMPRPPPPPPRPRSQFGKFPQNAVRAVARPTRTGSTLRRAGWGGTARLIGQGPVRRAPIGRSARIKPTASRIAGTERAVAGRMRAQKRVGGHSKPACFAPLASIPWAHHTARIPGQPVSASQMAGG